MANRRWQIADRSLACGSMHRMGRPWPGSSIVERIESDATGATGGRMRRRSGELPKIADAIGFPDHEIVQRLPRLVRDESDNDRVIDEAEKRSLVRNQIEW